jgi:hypothetical protein
MEAVLRRHGVPDAFIDAELSTLGDASCLPTANRVMVGVVNEYVCLAGTPTMTAAADRISPGSRTGRLRHRWGRSTSAMAAPIVD